ncbi:gamma-glutamylcyclotransferase family protein [Halovivax gelatinilyticus]|uniref:gamma-glutamylcyclotransferase family protein n=1 Tax=Halovivax gelatinilyticus TaxID=2961597 RepID=UPI0020CA7B67|nr:gamma-glutamylcyclotransferase family protein [Halovivax gelatinilyticus]
MTPERSPAGDPIVFVYGTLTDPDRAAAVVGPGRYEFRGSAALSGLDRVDGEYPTLVPGGSTDGRLLAVDETGLGALDAYEGVDRGLYVRVPVTADHPSVASDAVWCYVGDPGRLDAPGTWPGSGSFEDRVRTHVGPSRVHVTDKSG